MNYRKLSFTFWHNISITKKFTLLSCILFLLIIVSAVTGFLTLMLVRNAEKSIQMSTEIQSLVLEMDRGMERARHLANDFFLQYPVTGLSSAHESCAQPSIRQIARVIQTSEALKSLVNNSTINHSLKQKNVDLTIYLSSAKRFSKTSIQSYELVTKLVAPEWGLEAKLNKHLSELQSILEKAPSLMTQYQQLIVYTQNYQVKRKRFIMQSAFNIAFQLRKLISENTLLESSAKQDANKQIDRFHQTAESILDTDVRIKAIFNDFELQDGMVNPISEVLIKLASQEVISAQTQIKKTYNTAIIIGITVMCLGFLIVAFTTGTINSTVTRKLIDLNRAAGEFRQGNLTVSVPETSGDEIGILARTFNIMATRIRDSLDNLESIVAERTGELQSTNTQLKNEIEERSRAEASLRETKAILQAAMDHSQAGIAIADAPSGKLRYVNNAGLLIRGGNKETLIDNIDINSYVSSWQLLDLEGNPLDTDEVPLAYALFHKKPVSREFIVRRSDNEDRVVWANAAPIFNETNEVVAAIVIFLDITERKQAEQENEKLEGQLMQAQKMEAIGRLAGGIAHDFNNILAAILGYADIAREDLSPEHSVQEFITEIISAGNRAKDLVKQILAYSRKTQISMLPVQPDLILSEALRLIRATIPSTIEIRNTIHSAGSRVLADPTQLHQVIINLCTNAAHAMETTGGVLNVTLSEQTLSDTNNVPSMKPDDYVIIEISDSGVGIPEEIIDKIFDPYFTTKEIGKGSGMGLSVVQGIVQSHGGSILVDSTQGKGTRFAIYLPKIYTPQTDSVIDQKEPLPNGTEHILIVDDEPTMAEVTRQRLERLGYQVTTHTISTKALEIFRREPDSFDLVITDQTMPGLTGEQLAKEMIAIRNDIPVILCTGYSPTINKETSEKAGIRGFVLKPVDRRKLAVLIRDILD